MSGSVVYPSAVDAFLQGAIDVTTATLTAELLDGYSFDDAHLTIADVPGGVRFGEQQSVTVNHIAGGVVFLDPVTFPSVAAGNTVTAVVLFADTGTEATSPLLCCYGARADTTPVNFETNDGDVVFTWPRGFKL